MSAHSNPDRAVVLFKGGRLPTWHALSPAARKEYEQLHVDLMLDIARRHQLLHLEGFRLLSPQDSYERFWTIHFPTTDDARAWIEAEMEPPYGSYGYYEYDLAVPHRTQELNAWVTNPSPAPSSTDADPSQVPALSVDPNSLVVLRFERWRGEAFELNPPGRGETTAEEAARAVAQQHGLMRLECFALLGPRANWHRVWLGEFPDLAGAEAWIATWSQQPHGRHLQQHFHLTRKWAPHYFATWVSH